MGRNYFRVLGFNLLATIFALVSLALSSGCEEKHGLKIGDTPPELSTNDIHEKHVSLSQFQGKVVIVCFWADTCCGDTLKHLEPFYRQNQPKGLEVLAIDMGDPKNIVESYANTNAITFAMLTDEHSRIAKQFGVFGLPTIFILDRMGIVREKILGFIQIEKLEKLVERQFKIQKEIEANYEKTHPH